MNKEEILKFIESGENSLPLPMRPVDEYKTILEELGFGEGGWQQNGWEVDFWQDWTHPEHGTYVFAGSLYYGGWTLNKE